MSKVSILGCQISVLFSYKETYQKVMNYLIADGGPSYITVNNVHTVVEGALHKDYQNIINHAFLSFPDGRPLSITARLKGITNMSRIFGPTFFEKTLEWGQKDGLKHFLFGSSQDTLEKLKSVIFKRFPDIRVVGMVSPPFRTLNQEENEYYIQIMNNSEADIIWVALGAPKQERWIYENYQKLNHGIMIGIGAGFDYLAGNTRHAPQWMKNMALEWLYRLVQEPRRLWKRYLITNTLFVLFVVMELLGIKKFE